ncbi:hypothetical protein BDD12DRAFT_894028 [Trichophaea hybrida]|nr:hypothetical protein BDD12DRAFT_894028 [Trichophaea hybrida]
MPETNTNTNAAGSSSAMSTNSERYQTKYGPAVMLTRKNYDQWRETFEILPNSTDAWDIVNSTEVAPSGNTQGAVATRTDFQKSSSKSVSLITLLCSDEVRRQPPWALQQQTKTPLQPPEWVSTPNIKKEAVAMTEAATKRKDNPTTTAAAELTSAKTLLKF